MNAETRYLSKQMFYWGMLLIGAMCACTVAIVSAVVPADTGPNGAILAIGTLGIISLILALVAHTGSPLQIISANFEGSGDPPLADKEAWDFDGGDDA